VVSTFVAWLEKNRGQDSIPNGAMQSTDSIPHGDNRGATESEHWEVRPTVEHVLRGVAKDVIVAGYGKPEAYGATPPEVGGHESRFTWRFAFGTRRFPRMFVAREDDRRALLLQTDGDSVNSEGSLPHKTGPSFSLEFRFRGQEGRDR
jgi:hypothetical protein